MATGCGKSSTAGGDILYGRCQVAVAGGVACYLVAAVFCVGSRLPILTPGIIGKFATHMIWQQIDS